MNLKPFSLLHYFPLNLTYCYDNKIRDKLNPTTIYGEVYYNLTNPSLGYLTSNHASNFRYNDGNSLIHFNNGYDITNVKSGYFYKAFSSNNYTRVLYTYITKLIPRSKYKYYITL